jgi:hypothetical protein
MISYTLSILFFALKPIVKKLLNIEIVIKKSDIDQNEIHSELMSWQLVRVWHYASTFL